MDDMNDKPNIKRIYTALTEGGLVGKYTEDKCGIDLSEAFFQFIIEEEFEDEQIPEEFGDGSVEESFFADWLVTNKEMQESQAKSIWSDLNLASKGNYDPPEQKENIDEDFDAIYRNYNIEIKGKDLEFIKQQLKLQCKDLMPEGIGGSKDKELDKATYAVIQIGKQNKNQPLLLYLVDAFNRYRIQKRKQTILRLKKDGYNEEELKTLFDQKFKDPEPAKFIKDKCKGIMTWLNQYNDRKQTHFVEMCQAAITVFPRRLLHKPPMYPRIALVDDNIVKITQYIFQTYQFIEEFISSEQNNTPPLPVQIDVIIIPKRYRLINWDDDGDNPDDYDEKDDTEDNVHRRVNIGDINKRLASINNKIDVEDIQSGTANRTFKQTIDGLLKNRSNQRVIYIVDRRVKGDKDKCYGFQPNVNDKKPCHCFESTQSKLIHESLIQNLRICILPKLDKEKKNVTINTQKAFGLTFSFQIFSQNEIRVYLCNNGWGTRFFIEDVKYFLPLFFVKKQHKLLEQEFANDKGFQDKYAKCKHKCCDLKFETFYQSLFDDDKHKCH